MTWLIDIILVLIIAIAGYIGYRRGIVKMLLSFLTIVLALTLAGVLSGPLANTSYTLFFEKNIASTVDAALEHETMTSVQGAVEDLFSSEGFIGGIGGLLGFDTKEAVAGITGNTLQEVSNHIQEHVIKPPMVSLLRGMLFLLLFILLWILFSLISRVICHTTKLPLIKGVNAFAGGFVGLITGILLCFGLCALINLSLEVNPNGIFGITEITRDNSVIYKFISETFHTTFR